MRTASSLLLAVVAGALAIFGAPVTALALALAAVLNRRRSLVALLAVSIALFTALLEYPRRIDALRARLDAGGPEALATRDLAGIWLLNVGMAAGGACVGLPEVALETLLLAVPGPRERVFRGDVAMGSVAVEEVVDGYVALATRQGGDRVELPAHRLVLGTDGSHASVRAVLALNPVTVSGVAHREGDHWRLDLRGRVPVDYNPSYSLPLFRFAGRSLVIDEGLYDALERRGWLHPYTAEWRWTVSAPVRGAGS